MSEVSINSEKTIKSPTSVLENIGRDTQDMLLARSISYDAYVESLIKNFADVPAFTKARLIRYNSALPATKYINDVTNINPDYVPLLADPGIAFRFEDFFVFIEKHPFLSAIDVRKKYIESFPEKKYYRAIVHTRDIKNGHLAPTVREAIDNVDKFVHKYAQMNENKRKKDTEEDMFYLFQLPFLSRFQEQTKSHFFNSDTNGDFISVSEHPEIAWYAAADNEKEVWKYWGEQTKVRVFRFSMNSFYPLSRTIVQDIFQKAEGKYKLAGEGGMFELPANDPGVELLVPIALPKNYDADYRDYSPKRDSKGKPISFQFAQAEDWENM